MSEDKVSLIEVNKAIDEVNASARKLTGRYQAVGLMVLQHLADHGDVGPINRLYVGMPKGVRKLAMGQWLLAFGSVVVNQDKATKDAMVFKFDKTKKTDVAGAEAMPWYEFAPEKEISQEFDLQVAIKALLHRCKGKTLLIGGVPHKDQAETLLKAMAAGAGLAYEEGKKAEAKVDGAEPKAIGPKAKVDSPKAKATASAE